MLYIKIYKSWRHKQIPICRLFENFRARIKGLENL